MAIELKKYNRQVAISEKAAGEKGSLQVAGQAGMALAQAAEKAGTSINKALEVKRELDKKAERVVFDDVNASFESNVAKQSQDALLGQGDFAPVENLDGTITERRVAYENLNAEVVQPLIEEYTKWIEDQNYSKYDLIYVNATKNKTLNALQQQQDLEEFKRNVSEKKFQLEQGVVTTTTQILDIDRQWINNPEAMPNPVKIKREELVKQQQENITFLKSISDPGEAEGIESLVLYQSFEKAIIDYRNQVAQGLLVGPARLEALNNISKQIEYLGGGDDPTLLGKHYLELRNQAEIQKVAATSEIVTDFNTKFQKATDLVMKRNYKDLPNAAEELYQVTYGMPENLRKKILWMTLGELTTIADKDVTEDSGIGPAFKELNKLINSENTTIDGVLDRIAKVQDVATREMMMFVLSSWLMELGETNPNGTYKYIYNNAGQKFQLDSDSADFFRQTGSYFSIFEKEGTIQEPGAEAKFYKNKYKLFREWKEKGTYKKDSVTYEQFKNKVFGTDAVKLIENSYSNQTYSDIYGDASQQLGDIPSPFNFGEIDDGISATQPSVDQRIQTKEINVPFQDTYIFEDSGIPDNINLNEVIRDDGETGYSQTDIGFVQQNLSEDDRAEFSYGAESVDGLVMWDKSYNETAKRIRTIADDEKKAKARRAFKLRKEIEDKRAAIVVAAMKRTFVVAGSGSSQYTDHGPMDSTTQSEALRIKFGFTKEFMKDQIDRHADVVHPKDDERLEFDYLIDPDTGETPIKSFEDYYVETLFNKRDIENYDKQGFNNLKVYGQRAKTIQQLQKVTGDKITFTLFEPDDFDPEAWSPNQPIPITHYPKVLKSTKDGKATEWILVPIVKESNDGSYYLSNVGTADGWKKVYLKMFNMPSNNAITDKRNDINVLLDRGTFGNKYKQ